MRVFYRLTSLSRRIPQIRNRYIAVVTAALACLLSFGARVSAQDASTLHNPVERQFEALLAEDDVSNAFWGVHIVNLETGETLFSRNAARSFVPASNLKLYTTAAALQLLGPGFQYTTKLYAKGTIVDSTLHGSLVVRGAGDPSIGGRFTGGDRTRTFRRWADSLRANGIRRITGDLIGDDNIFDDEAFGTGWNWDDLTYWYAAPVSGLSYNDNCIDVYIRGNRPGETGTVSWRPYDTDYVTIENNTVTIAADSSLDEGYKRRIGSNEICLFSEVPEQQIDFESLSIDNPTRYHVYILRETLSRAGIQVDGRPVDIDEGPDSLDYAAAPDLHRIATHVSPPLGELVQPINKKSQNLYADQLFKTLGVHALPPDTDEEPGSFDGGAAAVESFLADAGVDTADVQLVDGSGLSRQNLVTPEATTQLLSTLWHHPDTEISSAFYESLPVGGVDGTLRFRFASAPVRGNIRAKTGYLSNTRSLSGYVTTRAGTPLAFAILCNNYTIDTDRIDHIQNRMVSHLVNLIGL